MHRKRNFPNSNGNHDAIVGRNYRRQRSGLHMGPDEVTVPKGWFHSCVVKAPTIVQHGVEGTSERV